MKLPIKFSGKVIKGDGTGKKIGFPTANILPDIDLSSLKHGVYACDVIIDGKKYLGAAHFGPRLVFDEKTPQFEVHILNFVEDIYNKIIDIEITKYVRETMRFKNLNELKFQIKTDLLSINNHV
mgnify:CR=1 FL=1